jgi:glycine/D-amino acid oxidase-like deaminating enzyme
LELKFGIGIGILMNFHFSQKATPVREWVGLRPGRPTIRLEMEKMQLPGDKILPVIHNYGHGGNGIALSWGCAVHVAKIAREVALDASSQ